MLAVRELVAAVVVELRQPLQPIPHQVVPAS
jgi:hypothetical protein